MILGLWRGPKSCWIIVLRKDEIKKLYEVNKIAKKNSSIKIAELKRTNNQNIIVH